MHDMVLAGAVALQADPGSILRIAPDGDRVDLAEGAVRVEIDAAGPHPFLVATPHGTARALGTGFSVAVRGGGLAVRVEHGRVAVDRSGQVREIGAGGLDTGGDDDGLTLAERLGAEPAGAAAPVLLPGIRDPALASLLADRWGFPVVVPFDGADPSGGDADDLIAAAAGRRAVVLVDGLVNRRLGDDQVLPAGAILTDAAGRPIAEQAGGERLLSPLAPDAVLAARGAAVGTAIARRLARHGVVPELVLWRARLPLALGPEAMDRYRRDPAVAAALAAAEVAGESPDAWAARQQGRVDRLIRDGARGAAGFGDRVAWVEWGGGWQPDQGRWGGWVGSVADAALRALDESVAMPVLAGYGWGHRDGGGTDSDDLTRLLAQLAGNRRLGAARQWVGVPAWDADTVPGWAAALAMLGVEGVVIDDPAMADLRAAARTGRTLPPPLHRALGLGRRLAAVAAAHPGLSDWPLVAAAEPHPYRARSPDLPWWRLPVAGDPAAVVLARRRPDGALVVLGWAGDGRARTVAVRPPDGAERTVVCTRLGRFQILPPP
ncbi:MAG: FecR protein [Planctomycetota bacterium]|jgi:hypothetical protein